MKFIKSLFSKEKNYTIHEIGGGDDDAYITFKIDVVTYMLLLEWEDNSDTMDITFGIEDEYEFNTTNHNKPYSVVNAVYNIVEDVMKFIEKKHGYNFTKVSFCSSNHRDGVIDKRSQELRDAFFLRRIHRNYPKANIDEEALGCLRINLYSV